MKQKEVIKLILAVLVSTILFQLFARSFMSYIDRNVNMPATYEEETADIQGLNDKWDKE